MSFKGSSVRESSKANSTTAIREPNLIVDGLPMLLGVGSRSKGLALEAPNREIRAIFNAGYVHWTMTNGTTVM